MRSPGLLPPPLHSKVMERRSILINSIGAEMPWPLLLSAIVHLALIRICCVPGASNVNDCIMVDLTISGPASPGTGGRNGKTESESAGGDKQVSQFHARPSSLRRESRKPERHPPRTVASEPERKAAPRAHSPTKPAMHQTTGVGGVATAATTAARKGDGSGVSSRGPVGLDTAGIGAGDGHGAVHGGDGVGKGGGGNGKGDGDGANGPVDGVLGTPGGPSFATRVIPVYPSFARRIGKEGSVTLRLHLDGSGHLTRVEIVNKAGYGFDEAALAAVRASTYRPAARHGRPVPCRALFPVRFELED